MTCYNVQFDAGAHEYTVNGAKVPNVTSICAPLGADLDEPDENLELALDSAAERGLTMHEYIAHRLNGGEREFFELPGIYDVYADSVELFLAEHEISPYLIETPLGCDYYAGTPDLVADFDGKLAILDWKFVSQIAKSKVMAQLGGYRDLCAYNDIFPSVLYAVQFLSDGKYRLYPVDVASAAQAFDICYTIQKIKNLKHPKGKIGGTKDDR